MEGRAIRPALSVSLLFSVGRHMSRTWFTASVLVSLLRKAVSSVVTFLGPSWDGPRRAYQPHQHYMRGPGPKWREKHLLDRTSASSR
jgi:hypothetical protein